jgi:hypothetical protein
MAHWRDGGIGNMAGSDDRPIEEWTLLEKLVFLTGTTRAPQVTFDIKKVAQEAFDEIYRVRQLEAGIRQWQPIETAPVEPWEKVHSYYRFNCLLQLKGMNNGSGQPAISQGYGYYVCAPRSKERRILRWHELHTGHQCYPKYWMPLPAPKED